MPLLLNSYTESSLRLSHVVVVPSVMALNGSECFVLLLGTGWSLLWCLFVCVGVWMVIFVEDGYVECSWSCGLYAKFFIRREFLMARRR